MCLSPIGDKLRLRLRSFPSLVSCSSPIWVLFYYYYYYHHYSYYYNFYSNSVNALEQGSLALGRNAFSRKQLGKCPVRIG